MGFQKNNIFWGMEIFLDIFWGVKSILEIFWGILKNQQFFGVLKISGIGLYVYFKYDLLSELNLPYLK